MLDEIAEPCRISLGEDPVLSKGRSEASERWECGRLTRSGLDITKWSTQKVHVALGTDTAYTLPKNEQGLSFFSLDTDGRVSGFKVTRRALAPYPRTTTDS